MIPSKNTQRPSWKRSLVQGARDVDALVRRGLVSPEEAPTLVEVVSRYQLLVSDYYLSLIDANDPHCPIRKQALPDPAELLERVEERPDPIGDAAHSPSPILVRRYPDRVLLFPTFQCPMFCRYCFRKVALNAESIQLGQAIDEALNWISNQPALREVILSGGDPLMLSDSRLDELLGRLAAIPHIRRLRIHTRFPVTLPMRIDAGLVARLAKHRPLYLVTHFNHPRELTAQAQHAVALLVDAGITVLNQSVLLRGINDDVQTLIALFEGLLDWQVRPYYLHHPDLTVGTQHFRISLAEGMALVRRLRGQLSGLALPLYVLDIPGGLGKVPVDGPHVLATETPGIWTLRSPIDGRTIEYRDPAHARPPRASS